MGDVTSNRIRLLPRDGLQMNDSLSRVYSPSMASSPMHNIVLVLLDRGWTELVASHLPQLIPTESTSDNDRYAVEIVNVRRTNN